MLTKILRKVRQSSDSSNEQGQIKADGKVSKRSSNCKCISTRKQCKCKTTKKLQACVFFYIFLTSCLPQTTIMHYADDEDEESSQKSQPELIKTDSEPSAYLSTDHTLRSKTISSLRSLHQPQSWPSSANLARDSDVYPIDLATPPHKQTLRPEESLDSSIVGTSLGHVKGAEIALYIPTPDGTESEGKQSSFVPSAASSRRGKFKCVEVCGSICTCASRSSTDTEQVSLASSEKRSLLGEPEYDIPQIGTFLDLPVSKKVLDRISFSETLIVSRDREPDDEKEGYHFDAGRQSQAVDVDLTQELGGMCISVEQAQAHIITYCTSQFSFQNSGATSTILAVVDRQFDLIEEKRTEALHKVDWKQEKSVHVFKEQDQFIAFRTSTEEGVVKRHRGIINLKVEGNLILDGGGFALMRYLIVKKFRGDLEVWSMHISGEVCRAVYNIGKRKLLMINNRPYETIRIVKVLFRAKLKPDISKTYFLSSGHIVRHRWQDCPYFFHMNPLARIPPCGFLDNLETMWEHDIQLFSKYLDFKQEKKAEIKSYLEDNSQAKSMIKDYLMVLLQNKPKYVLDFTINYFQSILNED